MIANINGGTRASGTPGYDASAQYVARMLRRAGYSVRLQEFTFPFFRDLAPGTLSQVAPTPTNYETGTFDYSASGDVTGTVVPIDVEFPPPGSRHDRLRLRTRRLPRATDRPRCRVDPARHLHVRSQGRQRGSGRIRRGLIFNEGQAGPHGAVRRHARHPCHIPVVGLSFATARRSTPPAEAGTVTVRLVTVDRVDPERTT